MYVNETFDTPTVLPWSGTWAVVAGRGLNNSNALQSPSVADGTSATASLNLTLSAKHFLSFYYGVSSEANYDWLRIVIDGTEIIKVSGLIGIKGPYVMLLEAGAHTFEFTYSKDGSGAKGDDCAWIDNFKIRELGTTALAVYNGEITAGGQDGTLLSTDNKIALTGIRTGTTNTLVLAMRAPGGAEQPVVTLKGYVTGPQADWFELSLDGANYVKEIRYLYMVNANVLLYIRANIPEDADYGNNIANYLEFEYLGGA